MKQIMKWTLGTMLVASITACSNEESLSQETTQDGKMTITALTPNQGSRVSLVDDGTAITVSWKTDDQISVLHYLGTPPGETITYTFVDGTTGKFTGDQHATTGGTYYAAYPVNPDFIYPKFYVDYAEQTGNLDESKTFMCAISSELTSNTTFEFKHVSVILKPKFLLNGEDVTSTLKTIQFTLPGNVYAGAFYDPATGGLLYSSFGSPKFVKVTRDAANLDKPVYIYLPGGTITEGDEIVVGALDINGKRHEGAITFTKDIAAGKVYTGTVELEDFEDKYAGVDLYTWTAETPVSSLLSGNGTDNNPYLIQNAQDLQYIAKYPATQNGRYARLEHDLAINSNESAPWVPIGYDRNSNAYGGYFDGNNKTISGNVVCGDSYLATGVFGTVSSGYVKNLNVDASIVVPLTTSTMYMAGIVGNLLGKNAFIDNCAFKGSVENHPDTNVSWCEIGGIAGRSDGHTVVRACVNKGTITGYNAQEIAVGGIVGNGTSSIMMDCRNEGTVSGNAGTLHRGTLIGYSSNATICTCCTASDNTLPLIGAGANEGDDEPKQASGCTNH